MLNSLRKGRDTARGAVVRRLAAFVLGRRANVAVLTALMIVPIVGALSLGGELGVWFFTNRSMHKAADSAAIAAASNASTTNDGGAVPQYAREAIAVASNYGFATTSVATASGPNGPVVTASGANGLTVVANPVASGVSNCPAAATQCFQVTISKPVPLEFAAVVGFQGDTTLNGAKAHTITATAIASPTGGGSLTVPLCILALGGTVSTGIDTSGAPRADLNLCNIASNGDADCSGHDLDVNLALAVHGSSGCANLSATPPGQDLPNLSTTFADPTDAARFTPAEAAADLAQCGGSFPGTTWTAAPSVWSTSKDNVVCGNLTLNAPGKNPSPISVPGGVLVIENGNLVITNQTLTSPTTGPGLAVVFSGGANGGAGFSHTFTPDGLLSYNAPATGPFSGVALYQDFNLTNQTVGGQSSLDVDDAGGNTIFDMTGLVYMPHADLSFKGAINKSGHSCVGYIVNTISVKGTGFTIDNTACGGTNGVTLPTGTIPGLTVELVE